MFSIRKNAAPIPILASSAGWKETPIQECGEQLVALGPFSEYPGIFQDSIYFGERDSSPYKRGELDGALLTPFIRKGIADRLQQASAKLPDRHAFLVWDAYRPLAVQRALYDDFHGQLIDKKGLSPDAATTEAQRFVSIPSSDPTRPSPHSTGGSIDLTIVEFSKEAWAELAKQKKLAASDDWQVAYKAEMRIWKLVRESKPLDMGSDFDEVGPATATRYFEQKREQGTLRPIEEQVLKNRRLLVNTLKSVGLSNYDEEWWHFDFGNQFHAKRVGQTAIYGAASFNEDCMNHEEMRRGNLKGTEVYAVPGAVPPQGKLGDNDLVTLVRGAAVEFGSAMTEPFHRKGKRLTVNSQP